MYEHVEQEGERPEKCIWWTMNAMDKLNSKLGDFINGIEDFDPLKMDYIYTSYGGDHRKGNIDFSQRSW